MISGRKANRKFLNSFLIKIKKMARFVKNWLIIFLLLVLISPWEKAEAATAEISQKEAGSILSNLESCSLVLAKDLDDLALKVDFSSFLGKTVKVPIYSEGSSKIPGGDADFLYLTPPKFVYNPRINKTFWTPLVSTYFVDGKSISKEKENLVKNQVQKDISEAFFGKKDLLIQLRDIVVKQIVDKKSKKLTKLDEQSSLWDLIFKKVKAEVSPSSSGTMVSIDSLLGENSNLTEEDALSQLGSSVTSQQDVAKIFDMNDPKTQQLFMLLFMKALIEKAAEANNLDKEACLNKGGEWVSDTCLFNQEDQNCKSGQIDFDSLNVGDGECHDISELKENCEEGGGVWYQKSQNSNDNISDRGSKFCKGSGDLTFPVGLVSSNSNNNSGKTKVYHCACPEGFCGDTSAKCISEDESAGDSDKDEVPNGKDKCPKTASGESVNMDETSADFGCSCTDLKKKGRVQAIACPPSECRGEYWIQYPASITADQVCQDGFVQSASSLCVPTQTMSQQCINQNQNNNKNQNSNDNSDIMKKLQDMLKDMNKQQGGGNSGGGNSGGGSSGGCGTGQEQGPGPSSPSQQPPSTTPLGANTNLKETLNTAVSNLGEKATSEQRQNLYQQIEKITSNSNINTNEQLQNFNKAVSESNLPAEQRAELYRASTQEALNNVVSNSNFGSNQRSELYNAVEEARKAGATPQESLQKVYETTQKMAEQGISQSEINKTEAQMEEAIFPGSGHGGGWSENQFKAASEIQEAYNRGDISREKAIELQNGLEGGSIRPSEVSGLLSGQSSPAANIAPFENPWLPQAREDLKLMEAGGASQEAIEAQKAGIAQMEKTMDPLVPSSQQITGGPISGQRGELSMPLSENGQWMGGSIGNMSAEEVQGLVDFYKERGLSMEEISELLKTLKEDPLNQDPSDPQGEEEDSTEKAESPGPSSSGGASPSSSTSSGGAQ